MKNRHPPGSVSLRGALRDAIERSGERERLRESRHSARYPNDEDLCLVSGDGACVYAIRFTVVKVHTHSCPPTVSLSEKLFTFSHSMPIYWKNVIPRQEQYNTKTHVFVYAHALKRSLGRKGKRAPREG